MASLPARRRAAVGDVVRATVELGLARLRLAKLRPSVATASENVTPLGDRQSALVERVAFVIPRVAARLPWRADCLVQALAAERWLGRAGVPTDLNLGVPRQPAGTFEAHAWLSAGDRIVTGGDVSGYVPLARP